jgi:hypothetical protein
MGCMGRLFDVRETFVRMLVLDLIGISYLVFGTEVGWEPMGRQWILAVVASPPRCSYTSGRWQTSSCSPHFW